MEPGPGLALPGVRFPVAVVSRSGLGVVGHLGDVLHHVQAGPGVDLGLAEVGAVGGGGGGEAADGGHSSSSRR